ncbi:hypothetical protein QQ213_000847 [Vibrio vulnificus]|nr:hypothetical protein [Vibrio vulnificus]
MYLTQKTEKYPMAEYYQQRLQQSHSRIERLALLAVMELMFARSEPEQSSKDQH